MRNKAGYLTMAAIGVLPLAGGVAYVAVRHDGSGSAGPASASAATAKALVRSAIDNLAPAMPAPGPADLNALPGLPVGTQTAVATTGRAIPRRLVHADTSREGPGSEVEKAVSRLAPELAAVDLPGKTRFVDTAANTKEAPALLADAAPPRTDDTLRLADTPLAHAPDTISIAVSLPLEQARADQSGPVADAEAGVLAVDTDRGQRARLAIDEQQPGSGLIEPVAGHLASAAREAKGQSAPIAVARQSETTLLAARRGASRAVAVTAARAGPNVGARTTKTLAEGGTVNKHHVMLAARPAAKARTGLTTPLPAHAGLQLAADVRHGAAVAASDAMPHLLASVEPVASQGGTLAALVEPFTQRRSAPLFGHRQAAEPDGAAAQQAPGKIRAVGMPLAAHGNDGQSWTQIGQEHLTAGRNGLAIEAFQKALGNGEPAGPAVNGLGIGFARLGRFDLALRFFREALAVDPQNERYAANLGHLMASPELAMRHDADLGQELVRLAGRDATERQTDTPEVAEAPEQGRMVRLSSRDVFIRSLPDTATDLHRQHGTNGPHVRSGGRPGIAARSGEAMIVKGSPRVTSASVE